MESDCPSDYYVKEWVILCQGVIGTTLKNAAITLHLI